MLTTVIFGLSLYASFYTLMLVIEYATTRVREEVYIPLIMASIVTTFLWSYFYYLVN